MKVNYNESPEVKAEQKEQALWGVIGMFGTFAIDMLIFYLGWNRIIAKVFSLVNVNMLQALGVVVFITFLRSEVLSKEKHSEYVGSKEVILHWFSEGIFAAILAIISIFI